jgi:hypothetical protein
MNFFEQQAAARRTSARLVLLFALAVPASCSRSMSVVWVAPQSPALVPVRQLSSLAVIGSGRCTASPAWAVAANRCAADGRHAGARRTPPSRDCAACATWSRKSPSPPACRCRKVYVLEHEAGINAFAAGYRPDAVIAVTRGALDSLNRDELQGVIAHEFSHILNGDMRLNIRLIGVLFGILMIGLIGRKILEHGRFGGRGKDIGAILVAALVAMLIGYVGLFFGRMIKAGVSRTREKLADASAVQFTRQTQGCPAR